VDSRAADSISPGSRNRSRTVAVASRATEIGKVAASMAGNARRTDRPPEATWGDFLGFQAECNRVQPELSVRPRTS
jgi:hypothetical protein